MNGPAVEPLLLDRFTDTLRHRGPDGRGTYRDAAAGIGLGHRRLSILDLSAAAQQPMSDATGRYWITFNGEIYNFLELRADLERCGHHFLTTSDTEVILAAYAEWGESCQLKFNGMWAFAIWDARERILFLSRDRFGVKPLLYRWAAPQFVFASELKAFAALEGQPVQINPAMVALAIADYSHLEGAEQTLLVGVRRLPGGHSLRMQTGQAPVIRRWWNTLDHLAAVPADYRDQVAGFRDLFLDACRIRMRSDVPLGTSLSGGLDSSAVCCAMAASRHRGAPAPERLATDWQRAFIATYPGTTQDETPYADAVVQHTGAHPVYCQVRAELLVDQLESFLSRYEGISDVHIGPWLVYQAQRAHGVVVSLDGHGGDELLGGYHHHLQSVIRAAMRVGQFPLARDYRRILQRLDAAEANSPAYGYGRLAREYLWRPLRRAFRDATAQRYWLRIAPGVVRSPILIADADRLRERDALFRALYDDFHWTTLPLNLGDYDRLAMAHGVEVRAPFVDYRLVCYAFALPTASKLGDGYTKRILRDATRDLLPDNIRLRQSKIGFSNPVREWLAGPLREFVLDSVGSQTFRSSAIWDGPAAARATEAAYKSGNTDVLRQVWRLVLAARLEQAMTRWN